MAGRTGRVKLNIEYVLLGDSAWLLLDVTKNQNSNFVKYKIAGDFTPLSRLNHFSDMMGDGSLSSVPDTGLFHWLITAKADISSDLWSSRLGWYLAPVL